MKEKIFFYIGEFKKAPLPMQNVVIKKGMGCILYIVLAIVMLKASESLGIVLPGIFLFGYLLYDFLRSLKDCCLERYSFISGECIQIQMKKQLLGLSNTGNRVDRIKIRFDQYKDVLIRIKNQREVANLEEGKMIGIYIPDYARVYQDGNNLRVEEYYCIIVNT